MTNETLTVEQRHRTFAADLLDELSSLLDHNGIGQVADLIRDGEYDEHIAPETFARFEQTLLTQEGRGDLIEQCAKVAESTKVMWPYPTQPADIAAAIRSLAIQSPDLAAGDAELKRDRQCPKRSSGNSCTSTQVVAFPPFYNCMHCGRPMDD